MMKKIFIVGASSDLAESLIPRLIRDGNELLLHCGNRIEKLSQYKNNPSITIVSKVIKTEDDCVMLTRDCARWNSEIDGLVILIGGVSRSVEWDRLKADDYIRDYWNNTVYPVIIASELCDNMKKNGGRIIFVSTASAAHGGGRNSLSYGMAKAALECATKRLAKDLAQFDILVNAIAPGYMDTSLQIRAKGIPVNENKLRLDSIPIGRAGTKDEFAGLVDYMLTDDAGFMTGQVITMDGGDFI